MGVFLALKSILNHNPSEVGEFQSKSMNCVFHVFTKNVQGHFLKNYIR